MPDQVREPLARKRGAPPLLRPEHFRGLRTGFGSTGLTYSSHIGHSEREESCPGIGATDSDMLTHLDKLRDARPPSKVVVNPRTPSARELVHLLESAEAGLPDWQRFHLGLGIPQEYVRRWDCDSVGSRETEGQIVVAVLFDPIAPIGSLDILISLTRDRVNHAVELSFELGLVYVRPDRRGEGFGLDLSVAGGHILRDVLSATYRAVAVGTTVSPHVSAELHSTAGERIANHLVDCLDFERDLLREFGRRRTVHVNATQLRAGY